MKLFVFVCIIAVALAKRSSVLEGFLEEFLRDVTDPSAAAFSKFGVGNCAQKIRIGNPKTVKEAQDMFLSKPACKGATLQYSGYSYSWGAYCCKPGSKIDSNENWKQYVQYSVSGLPGYRKCNVDEHNPMKCVKDGDCCGDDVCKARKNMYGIIIGKKCASPCYNYDYDNCKEGERKKDCLNEGPKDRWIPKVDKIYKIKGQCYKVLYNPTVHKRKIESGCGAMCKGGKFYNDIGDSCGGGDSSYVKNPRGSTRNKCCSRERIGLGSVRGGNQPEITCCKDKAVPYDGEIWEDVETMWCEEALRKYLEIEK